jgi:hypothetical protein
MKKPKSYFYLQWVIAIVTNIQIKKGNSTMQSSEKESAELQELPGYKSME